MRQPSATDEQRAVLDKTETFVREKLGKDSTGHDWWHIHRVRNNALRILAGESSHCDAYVVELAALLHDIADWKFHGGDTKAGSRVARNWLKQQGVPEKTIEHVCEIIDTSSFKGAGVANEIRTREGMIVQDADRLDAIGAVGIARTFAYGGRMERLIYDPEVSPTPHNSFEEYKNSKSHTVNHFYEKLLLLKDRMNTQTARELAQARHAFMEEYLERFFSEWAGET
jgi:uncharacterized protein